MFVYSFLELYTLPPVMHNANEKIKKLHTFTSVYYSKNIVY